MVTPLLHSRQPALKLGFHTNLGFVPIPAGLGWGPKATALLDVNRKTRGSLNLTPFPKTFPPMGFQAGTTGHTRCGGKQNGKNHPGLGFWETAPPWSS